MKYLNYNIILTLLIILLTVSCEKNNSYDINKLNGYWEIESVVLSNGNQKEYTFSDTIDFISFHDSITGYRKKLKPNFNGNYETSNHVEEFIVKIENDSLNLYYKTQFHSWKETVLMVNEYKLSVINENSIIYNYKRYEPLNLN